MACGPAYQVTAFKEHLPRRKPAVVCLLLFDNTAFHPRASPQDACFNMLNRLKEETAARILRDIPTDGPVRKSVIDDSSLPENLRQFLVRMLERRIELAMRESFDGASEWFDSSTTVARDLMTELLDSARETARFPQDQWVDAVRRATDIVVRYTVKPVDTLVLFAFGVDGESIHSADLRRCVRFFRDHRPMRRAVIHFLDGHPTDPVARADFEEGLRHFHDRLTSENAAEQWVEALEPLQELTAYSGLKRDSVPVEGAVVLFRHLGLERVADRIDEEAGRRDALFVTRVTLDQLVRSELSIEAAWSTIPDTLPEHTSDATPTNTVEATPAPRRQQSGDSDETDASKVVGESTGSEWAPGPGWTPPLPHDNEPEPEPNHDDAPVPDTARKAADGARETDDGDVPLWKQYQPAEPDSKAAELESSEAPLWKKYREDRPTTGSRIAADAAVKTDTSTVGGLDGLELNLLGERAGARSRYVRILFKGDTDAYAETLAMLSEVSSWDQASKILSRRVFRKYEVDIYGDAAVEFTDALERSFSE